MGGEESKMEDPVAQARARAEEEARRAQQRRLPPQNDWAFSAAMARIDVEAKQPTVNRASQARIQEMIRELERDAEAQSKMQGASVAVIEMLPVARWSRGTASRDQASCMVCLEDYEEGVEVRTLPCLHAFHKSCADQWCVINKNCPVCKRSIDPQDRFR
eukprot:tig00001094_g7005.t1